MSNAGHEYTDREIERLVKEFDKIFDKAAKDVEKQAADYLAQFEEQDKKRRLDIERGLIEKEEYGKWRVSSVMTGKDWKKFQEQAAETLLKANRKAMAMLNGTLPSVYMFNYNDTGKGAETFLKGYSFNLINERALAILVRSNKTLLPYKYVLKRKYVRWNTKKVNAEILQGLIRGESIPKIARRLRNVTEMDRASAIRNARTAMTGAENHGTLDGMRALAEDGVIVEKEWISSHDKRTRDSHKDWPLGVGGESVPVDEEFSNGLMYPGDPDGDPEEVYNCRCSMVTNILGFKKI